ncbi:MAG TPA: S41 family peptidase [Paucimonas sp.]|nr:S41 family peptidase [Paucimonas sp.]
MRPHSICLAVAALALAAVAAPVDAAESSAPAAEAARRQSAKTLDAASRGSIVDTLARKLVDRYVFPDVAKRMADDLRAKLAGGAFDAVSDPKVFAAMLTDAMRAISRDKHIRVAFRDEPVPEEPAPGAKPDAAADAAFRARAESFGRATNYGFEKVERLEGNVAYLELRGFQDADLGRATAAAAMNMVANAEALIVDLRRNGGGEPAMVAFVSSYLFDGERVHLNDLYWRADDRTEEFWTDPAVPGPRFGGKKPVYVLTGKRTFSGAEEFSYNLKALKRATIVGETTGGGAHPGDVVRIGEYFGCFIPTGRAINPITKTNWEGTGVAPDVAVPQENAFDAAYRLALKAVADGSANPALRRNAQHKLAELEAAANRK